MAYPKRKYRRGHPIFSLDELLYKHLSKGRWVFWLDKVKHPSFIMHMTLNTVVRAIERRAISEAIDQHKEWAEGRYANSH